MCIRYGFFANWWLAIVCLVGLLIAALINGWTVEREVEVPASEIAAFEHARLRERAL